jgi:hypothetical protein
VVVGLRIRLVFVALAGLVLAAPAEAAYTSARLSVVNTSKAVASRGTVTLTYAQRAGDDATARVVTYVPRGYVPVQVRPDEVLGTARAGLAGGETRSGTLRGAERQAYEVAAKGCLDEGTLDDVSALYLADFGGGLELPIFVRTIRSGSEAAFASMALTFCFDAARPVLGLSLIFRGLFTNPSTAGAYRWRSLWTPYRDGTRAATATVEAQALDLLPVQLTLVTGRFDRRTRSFFVGGALLENRRPLPGGSIQLLAGLQGRPLGRLGLTRTNANGNYGGRMRLTPGTWNLRSRATVRARTRGGCAVRTLPGVRCLRTTTAGYTLASRTVRVVVPAR